MKFCSQPWDTISIDKNGKVAFCHCPAWNTYSSPGNLNDNTLTEILKNSNTFRQSIIDQTFKYCNKMRCQQIWSLPTVENLDFVEQLDKSLPTSIQLLIDNTCTLKCPTCRDNIIYDRGMNVTARNILAKLADEYKDFTETVFVYCDGTGDIFASQAWMDFLNSDTVPKCFKFCFTTHGNLIIKNIELIKRLHENNNIDIFIVSFDAATAETYSKTRGGNFAQMIAGVEKLIEMGIVISTQYVIQRINYHEVESYIALCKKIGVSYIGTQLINRWSHMTDAWWNDNKITDNDQIDHLYLFSVLTNVQHDTQCVAGDGVGGYLEHYSQKQGR